MSEKKISYLDRTFDDYRESLLAYVKSYYPNIADKFDDASIGSWLIDMAASIGDNLSYHIDRVFNETNIDSASERSSVMSIARTNGLKIQGPKPSVAEEKFTCKLPVAKVDLDNDKSTVGIPNWAYAPVLKKGTRLNGSGKYFEISEDIDFKEQFDSNGYSDRQIEPIRDTYGNVKEYLITKYGLVYAGETKIYRQVISSDDITPFMEIVLPDQDIMNIESIIFKAGTDYSSTPTMGEFMNPNEYVPATSSQDGCDTYRFFEVDSLLEQYRWGDDISTTKSGNEDVGKSVAYTYGYYSDVNQDTIPTASVTKGQWVPLTQKFMTEYTDNGYLKIIFGSGEIAGQTVSYDEANDFSKNQISKMIRNNFLGKLPKGGWTMFVQYRVGGGEASNVAKGVINSFAYLNAEIGRCLGSTKDATTMGAVRDSLTCTNTTASISGKDMPTTAEIKNMIKYHSAENERCVCLKDYISRIKKIPPKYGCPFRVSGIESNNKIMLYLLNVDGDGKLSTILPSVMVINLENYLSKYRSINDYVEMKSGVIINISFEIEVYINKDYNYQDVIKQIITTVQDYMDINKHEIGEDIYVGDIEKEISKVDGVMNLIGLNIYNEYKEGVYSTSRTSMPIVEEEGEQESDRSLIDLEANDYILSSDSIEMFEVKYGDSDIKVKVKLR